jgi:hypothetical protein
VRHLEVNLMATIRVFQSLLASCVLPIAAWASQPPAATASDPAPSASLAEEKFQRVARTYKMYQHEGQTVYCKKERVITSTIPHMRCLTEPQLRAEVESQLKWRNPVTRPLVAGIGQGGIG